MHSFSITLDLKRLQHVKINKYYSASQNNHVGAALCSSTRPEKAYPVVNNY